MTISLRGRVLALTFLVALVAAACGGNGNDASSSGGSSTGTATGASSATAGSGSTGSSSGGSRYGGYGSSDDTGATGSTMQDHGGGNDEGPTVQANNYAFAPTTVKVKSGAELYLKNGNANTPHTFTIDGTDIDVALAPLANEEVKVDLDPGTYGFHCKIHSQMTGTLTVT